MPNFQNFTTMKNTIKAVFILTISLILTAIGFIMFVGNETVQVIDNVQEESKMYKARIGTKYVLEKDTFTIIDYSQLEETFTLSNGKKVNSALIFTSSQ